MKKTAVTLIGVIIAVIGLHAFRSYQTTAVTGKLHADPKRSRITARNGHDSVEAGIASDSTFHINLTRGKWLLELTHWQHGVVQNIVLDSMVIGESGHVNLGELITGL